MDQKNCLVLTTPKIKLLTDGPGSPYECKQKTNKKEPRKKKNLVETACFFKINNTAFSSLKTEVTKIIDNSNKNN